jgi:L-fuconolactonase
VTGLPRNAVPVLDAHVHFWDPALLHYPWLASVPALDRAFTHADYAAAARAAAPVRDVLFVEANCLPDEAAREVGLVRPLGSASPRVAGIVAFVDLAADARAVDRALAAREQSPLVRGIRHNIQGQPAGFCLRPEFVDGVVKVGNRGLAFDLCVTHDQLVEAEQLVRLAPNTRFVLDHCGKPAIRERRLDPWRADLARLAAHPNVWCKLSGVLTEAGPGWREEDLRPYVAHVVECFGRDRLLYGSDWPVLTLAGGLADWYAFADRLTAGWRAEERQRFFAGTAERVYGLSARERTPGRRTVYE